MDRPEKENYECHYFELPYEYVVDLEEYCKKLEKALDKACELMSDNLIISYERLTSYLGSKEAWKEWLMKDE